MATAPVRDFCLRSSSALASRSVTMMRAMAPATTPLTHMSFFQPHDEPEFGDRKSRSCTVVRP